MAMDVHPAVKGLAPILGTWEGRGSGFFPTISPFEYREEVVFSHVGKPFFSYVQKTRSPVDGTPMHAEMGFIRVPKPGHVELVVAQPSGVTEIDVGVFTGCEGVLDLDVASTAVGLTPTAKEVTALVRTFHLEADQLSYTVKMAAMGEPLQDHLVGVLTRRR